MFSATALTLLRQQAYAGAFQSAKMYGWMLRDSRACLKHVDLYRVFYGINSRVLKKSVRNAFDRRSSA